MEFHSKMVSNLKEYAQKTRGLPTSNPNRLPTPDRHLRSETLHTTQSPIRIRSMKSEGIILGKENREKLLQLEEKNARLKRENEELLRTIAESKFPRDSSILKPEFKNSELETKLQRKKQKNRAFKSDLDKITRELQEKTLELENLRKKYFELESSLHDMHKSKDQTSFQAEEMYELKHTISNLKNNLSRAESDKQKLMQDNTILASKHPPARGERDIHSGKSSAYGQLEEKLKILMDEMEILISDKSRKEQELEEANKYIEKLKSEPQQRPFLTSSVPSQRIDTYRRDEEIRDLRTQLQTLRSQREVPSVSPRQDIRLNREIEELKEQLDKARVRERQLESRLRDFDGDEFELKNTKFLMEQKGGEMEKLYEDNRTLEKRLHHTTEDLEKLNQDNERLRKELRDHQREIEDLQRSHRDISERMVSTSRKNEEEGLANKELKARLREREVEIQDLKESFKRKLEEAEAQKRMAEKKLLELLQATEENLRSQEENEYYEGQKLQEIKNIRSYLESITDRNPMMEEQFQIERQMYEKTIEQLRDRIKELERYEQAHYSKEKSSLIKKVQKSPIKDSVVKSMEDQLFIINENLSISLQQKSQLESQNAALQKIIDNQAEYLKDLKHSLLDSKERNEKLAQILQEWKAKGYSELEMASETEERLMYDLEMVTRERDILRAKSDSAEREIVHMNQQLLDKMRELDKIKGEYLNRINDLRELSQTFKGR